MRNYFFLIRSAFFGKPVGVDPFGNIYYCSKNNPNKRWVVYYGNEDATKIPPQWYGWLHGFMNIPLSFEDAYSWQKKHTPNLTGTLLAHKPHDTTVGSKNQMGYTPWRP
jgi:NADH:ubiquinone oxidoreductase subunit